MLLKQSNGYRKDIDGLRAIAVVVVIAFHFGFLPSGYLGVDVFFVISGYLITGIIYREIKNDKFSIVEFYIRRTRRILPLTLFVVFFALLFGIFVMLPDDLENLAQSVVATNIFSNNILQAITTKNYWDIANEFKPLMHTWSLGVEEQYYIAYPILLAIIGRHHKKLLIPALTIIGSASLILYLLPFNDFIKFYHLPFRFFELAIGGIAALHLQEKVFNHKYSGLLLTLLIMVLIWGQYFIPKNYAIIATVTLTLSLLISSNENNKLSSLILQNRISISIGVISFSLYMWHQVILAYSRYIFFQKPEKEHILIITLIIITISIASYQLIEKPFRNRNKLKTNTAIKTLAFLFFLTTVPSLYIYWNGGIIRDVPELDIKKENSSRNIHAKYNSEIFTFNKNFEKNTKKTKILIIGNSFARDWANVLLESKYKEDIEISYTNDPLNSSDFKLRSKSSDIIFYSTANKSDVNKLKLDYSKIFIVGTKNFGINNGYFYNYSGEGYFKQRTFMEDGYIELNNMLKTEWGNKYIDIINKIIDKNGKVPIFTDKNMFISQDCRHLTKAGATYLAKIFDEELFKIIKKRDNYI